MAINFSECDVIVNGTGIMANSASISQKSSFVNVSPIGYFNSSVKNSESVIISDIDISYVPKINDVNLLEIQKIKLNPFDVPIFNIEIGGLKCPALIKSYNLSFSPNEPAAAAVSFTTFYPVSGKISKKRGTVNYDANESEFLHSWAVRVDYGHTGFQSTYGFSYSCELNYQPIFCLGGKSPIEIIFLEGSETLSLVKEKFLELSFSGDLGNNSIIPLSGSVDSVTISNINNYGTDFAERISLDFKDSYATESKFNASLNNYATTEINLERRF